MGRSLVVVPGLFGTHIVDGERPLWGTLACLYAGPPVAMPDRLPGRAGHPLEAIRVLPGLRYDVIGALLAALEAAGYRRGKSLHVFPYDWRLRVLEAGATLAARIRELATTEGDVVDLLGLSTGGLVARAAVALDSALPIGRIVTSGAPHGGTLETVACLHHGFRFAPLGRRLGPAEFLACPGSTDGLPPPGAPVFISRGPAGQPAHGHDLYDVKTWEELKLAVFQAGPSAPPPDRWRELVAERLRHTHEMWSLLVRAPAPRDLVCIVGEGLKTQTRLMIVDGRVEVPGEGRAGKLPADTLADGDGAVCVESATAWTGATPRVIRIPVARHRDMVRTLPAFRAILGALARQAPSTVRAA